MQSITGGSTGGSADRSGSDSNSQGTSSGDPDVRLRQQADKLREAVGVVVVVAPLKNGSAKPQPHGTAFAIDQNTFATNAHIAKPVGNALKHGVDVFIAMSGDDGERYRVTSAAWHRGYKTVKRNMEGKKSVPFTNDVGFLEINGSVDQTFQLANNSTLRNLSPGQNVAFLGYPMESLIGNNLNIQSPVPTMQSGIVTAVTDYWQGDGGFEKNVLVRHNLPSTGGASGSPIFTPNGEVVAILNAGNSFLSISADGQTTKLHVNRIPHAAQVNFAQRIDLLRELQ